VAGWRLSIRLIPRYRGVPIHGCRGPEGLLQRHLGARRSRAGRRDPARASFIMAVELTKTGPRMRTILIYGQSAGRTAPHRARLYTGEQWVVGLFTETEPEIARDSQPHCPGSARLTRR
jgi:acyl-homoserine-lactone acylase